VTDPVTVIEKISRQNSDRLNAEMEKDAVGLETSARSSWSGRPGQEYWKRSIAQLLKCSIP
jgi:hypothetical protein